jgi:hypothetical protein
MSISYFVQNDLLLVEVRGEISFDEFNDACNDITCHLPLAIRIDTLLDLRGATIDIPRLDFEAITRQLRVHRYDNKIGILADRGSFPYVIGRMFCLKAANAGLRCDIFISEWKAKAWLCHQGPD